MEYFEILLLGAGLATDASCVSASNGLIYRPKLHMALKMAIAYAVFQFVMPVLGFLGASLLPTVIYQHNNIIACVLLLYIGGKMTFEIFKKDDSEQDSGNASGGFTNKLLLSQGIATSIDALSVGFAFTGMMFMQVLDAALIIAVITFIMCLSCVKVGILIGDRLNDKAELIGGIVLMLLGVRMLFH